ncbi:GTP-binding signal recognition particle SRP54 G-domain-containing protein [Conexibacter woesei]|uniref:GTP-binding signal recognition particle SRP54 G-domain protein n=1 Tax=Conexibacter woesei (strain DSM 14684 / CCUG 47730 / CIP 108061 / JCM 11494 / NBRC 100937 / ID131577) TaxID=469383 RepID=D3F424_CONWI|nr:GTP-binding signal recognition particle SRP54 G-domain-containing protein [Conexibacter woesei]ADB48507.1 GTP-binding signal recognition particle SRP54 G-domain protein [Conexibacter woesei DSM 14684]
MSSQVDDRPKTNGHVPADPSLRTYRGRSLEEILPQIRAELGPDAVVVRQRDGLMGGIGGFFQQQFVEVQARAGGGKMRLDVYDDEPALPEPLQQAAAEEPAPPSSPAAFEAPRPVGPPASSGPESLAPAPRAGPTAAELLAQATGSAAGDPRTPAEILRAHSGTFAKQLADAEERAEPTVRASGAASAAADEPTGRYAPPVPADAAETEPIPLPPRPAPAPVPAPEPELPPAARAAPVAPAAPARPARATARRAAAKKRRGAAKGRARAAPAARAPAPRAEPAARVPAASAEPATATAAPAARAAPVARTEPVARVPTPEAAPAPRAAPSVRAEPAPRAATSKPRAKPAKPAAAAKPESPASGVGPRTTQALELAAAIAAANLAARAAASALPAPARPPVEAAEPAPAQPGTAGPGTELVLATAPSPAPPAASPRVTAPRRSLFGRRSGATTPRRLVDAPAAAEVTGSLAAHGLAPAAAEELLVDATAHVLPFTPGADVRTAVRSALARRIPLPAPPRLGGRVVAFVGAGGGGKTRCTAGLAAAYAQGSSVPVACLTFAPADGGAELTALLKPHGVKVEAVATAEAAAKRLAALRAEALVVLDTPAVSPGDPDAVARMAAELAPLQLDEIQLVVPATLSATVAEELVERLAPLQPTGIAMTHADATDHIGAVVDLACATRLPLAYVNSGLELPGALAPADPAQLAERLLS